MSLAGILLLENDALVAGTLRTSVVILAGILRLVIFLPEFVEELRVAAVIVAAQQGTVTGPHKAVLFEDPLHAVVVGQGRASDGCEAQGIEFVVYEEANGDGDVSSASHNSGPDS